MPTPPGTVHINPSELSNDLTENEQLYQTELDQLTQISDLEFSGGTLMEIDWMEGDLESRLDQKARLESIVNARGNKIDALLTAQEQRAQREAEAEARLERMRAARNAAGTKPAATQTVQNGPNVDPSHAAGDIRGSRGDMPPELNATGREYSLGADRMSRLPHPMEFVLRELGGNLHALKDYNGRHRSVDGGIWMSSNDVNLRAINLNDGLNNAAIQQQPTVYEGPAPIYLTDFLPVTSTSVTSLTWDDTTALAATLPTRKDVGNDADAADPTAGSQTISISRLPMYIVLDNRLLMSPIAAAEYATTIMNQTWGTVGSNEITTGDGSAPNQRGIHNRANIGTSTFSRATGNIYANFIRAVNQAQALRVKRGFVGGTVVMEPQLLYALLDYRESGRPVFNSDVWPIRKFGLTFYPTLGHSETWSSANSQNAAVLMNFAQNSMNWVQGMNLRMLHELDAMKGQTRLLLEIYNMYQFRQAADIYLIQSAA